MGGRDSETGAKTPKQPMHSRHTNLQRSFILLKIKNVKAAIIRSERREEREEVALY